MNSIINDQSCFWINQLPTRSNINKISKDDDCEYLIIGAGYTGLSAARKLAQLQPEKKNYYSGCSNSRRGC